MKPSVDIELLEALEPYAYVDCTPLCLGTGWMLVKSERWMTLKCLVLDGARFCDLHTQRRQQYELAEQIIGIVEKRGWEHCVRPKIDIGSECHVYLDIRHKDY